MRFAPIIAVLAASLLFSNTSRADLAPESVLLVVNGDSPSSLAVANAYVDLRQIPDCNILTLSGVTNVEQMSVDDFRKQILVPVLAAIEQRGLVSQIRCVAYSTDLPTAINVSSDIGNRKLPQIITPVASINGLTFLHQLTMTKDIRYLDLNANLYARRVGVKTTDALWQPEELRQYAAAIQRLGLEARRPRSNDQPADASLPANDPSLTSAFDALVLLKQAHPQSPELLYNLACAFAIADRNDEALATLKDAVVAGWFDHRHAARDPDLISVKDREEFKRLLSEMQSVRLDVQPTRGFRNDVGWLPNGDHSPNQQPRYLLSTVLGVTAGRGLQVSEVIAGLRRSAAADGTRPSGTVYYIRNGDVRSTTREWGFASAVEKLKAMGVDAVIEDGVLPHKKERVAGAMIGISDFDWPKCESNILAGAIVEHLTSFGGVMTAGAGQTPLTEFLRHGAAGASGTVTEPYALQAKFPNPFIHVHYASGVTLAEAFYLSVTGPYQLLVVGDPLCNPWRRELSERETDSANRLAATKFALYVDGKHLKTVRPEDVSKFDTTQLPEGEHQVAIFAMAEDDVGTISRRTMSISNRNTNTDRSVKLTTTSEGVHPFGKPLELEGRCSGAAEILIYHLGRVVAKIAGESGVVRVDTKLLGLGPVVLQPIASLPEGGTIRGPMLKLTIQSMAE